MKTTGETLAYLEGRISSLDQQNERFRKKLKEPLIDSLYDALQLAIFTNNGRIELLNEIKEYINS